MGSRFSMEQISGATQGALNLAAAFRVDLATAGKSDRLEDTLDYREAIAIVKQHIKTAKFALVETLIEAIANELLSLEKINQVRVKLSKPTAPIPDFGGKITLDITRRSLN